MSHKIAKRVRKEMFLEGKSIQAEPYRYKGKQRIASPGRREYQRRKREAGHGKL